MIFPVSGISYSGTGIGTVANGQGVAGLGRAFTLAGAKTVVLSLWDINDRHTVDVMVGFYKALFNSKCGISRAKALKIAQQESRKSLLQQGIDRPSLWGAFVLYGALAPSGNT